MTKKLIYIFGSAVIGMLAVLTVVFTMIGTGAIGATPDRLVFRSATAEMAYSGETLTAQEWELVSGELKEGHTATVTVSGSQTDVGESDNFISVVIHDARGADVTDHYSIEYQVGKLRVMPRGLELISGSSEKVYDGIALKNENVQVLKGALMEGHSIAFTVTGEQTSVGVSDNIFTVEITDENGKDVKWQYALNIIYGKLTVSKKEIIVASGSATKVYDGTPLTNEEASLVSGSIMEGHSVSVKAIGSIVNAGQAQNTVQVTVTDKSGADVTGNYEIVRIEGVLEVLPIEITVTTATTVKVYDGKPTSANQFTCPSESLILEGHKITNATMASSITDVGTVPNTITDIVIKDSEGNEVTFNYKINVAEGSITVTKRQITIRSGSDSKEYDGTPLTCDKWEVVSITNVVEGHTLEVSVSGTITEVGTVDNTIAEALITDAEGKSVVHNYEIITQLGTLSIKDKDAALEAPKPNEKGEASGMLDISGSIELDEDLSNMLMLEIMSDVSDSVYLKLKSFGDYNGKEWLESTPYSGLLSGKYGMSYLVGSTLMEGGNAPCSIKIKSYTGSYVLPVYISTGDGEYTVQTKDNFNEGSESEYTVPYFVYKGYGSDITPTAAYSAEELLYRDFVYSNYLNIDKETADYMQSLIEREGFDADDSDIVSKVAAYIRGCAEYNLKYNKALDDESNKVIAFLETYKEGICQHYASAATLLFRQLGIPARYTVGFSASTEADNWAEVTAKQAHAWVEVYINGVGWISVEVTGGSGSDSGGELPDGPDSSLPEGDIMSDSTNLSGPPANMKEEVMLKIKSDESGTVYLRNMSYGDYTGKGWLSALAYNKLLSGTHGMNYLPGVALKNNGAESIGISIELVPGCPYVLPYFTTMEKYNYDIQISDTVYVGSEDVYSMYYYSYTGYGEWIKDSLGEYTEEELLYRDFVYSRYLTIDSETKAYFDNIISKRGFSADDKKIIENVAEFIKNSAEYSLTYDRNLDNEENIVIAFLDKYKEGICQHYASSAVLFYRALGIPARYVTGFMASAVEGEWADVTNKQAHAWVEVYIDGVGWMPVEVTGSGGDFSSESGYTPNSSSKINIRPENVSKKYDGTPLTATNIIVGLESLLEKGLTYEAVVEGERTELGISKSQIVSFTLYDAQGKDVTDKFEIVFNPGKVHVYISELNITTDSAEKVYDGEELVAEGCEYTGELSYGHKVKEIYATGSALNVGETVNGYKISIVDENGADVTDFYKMNASYGILSVSEKVIHITANSDTKVYDGTPLINDGYELDGELGINNYLELEIKGSQTNIGKSENTVSSIKIVNALNKDVTDNYKITYTNGVLFVTPNLD